MMSRKWILCLIVVMTAVLLCACGKEEEKKEYATAQPTATPGTQQIGSLHNQNETETGTQGGTTGEQYTVTDVSDSAAVLSADSGLPYNPLDEEGGQDEQVDDAGAPTPIPDTLVFQDVPIITEVPTPTMFYDYAGTTPVPIDPIDKPTPTPLPTITFSHTTYEATALHVTFEGPAGWIVDDTASDTFTLTNPDTSMDYAATATIRVTPVNTNYTKRDLEKEVTAALNTIRSEGEFSKFEQSKTATRSFVNKDGVGVYANYTATTKDGVKLAGRILIDCKDKKLYILHCTYPQALAETFKDGVFAKIRSTLKIVETPVGN